MSQMYLLDGHEPVPAPDTLSWARAFDGIDRQVALDRLGGALVSTVFLGLDHSFFGGPPILFETMVFGGDDDGAQWRYSTWDEAAAAHADVCDAYWRHWYSHPEDAWWEH